MPDNSSDNLDDLDRGATRPRDDRDSRDDRDTLDSAHTLPGAQARRSKCVSTTGKAAAHHVSRAAPLWPASNAERINIRK